MLVRPTARMIVLDNDDRVLLFKVDGHALIDPNNLDRPQVFWIAPGGGVEDGESFEAAAVRELREETGLVPTTVGPCILEQDIHLREGERDIVFRTQFILVRVATTDVSIDGQIGEELENHREHRWWSVADLDRTEETFFPEELPTLLRGLIAL